MDIEGDCGCIEDGLSGSAGKDHLDLPALCIPKNMERKEQLWGALRQGMAEAGNDSVLFHDGHAAYVLLLPQG